MGLAQDFASKIMTALGIGDTFGRFGASIAGDYFKGWVLPMYTVLAIGLALVNILGTFATNAVHITIYAVGLCSLP